MRFRWVCEVKSYWTGRSMDEIFKGKSGDARLRPLPLERIYFLRIEFPELFEQRLRYCEPKAMATIPKWSNSSRRPLVVFPPPAVR